MPNDNSAAKTESCGQLLLVVGGSGSAGSTCVGFRLLPVDLPITVRASAAMASCDQAGYVW